MSKPTQPDTPIIGEPVSKPEMEPSDRGGGNTLIIAASAGGLDAFIRILGNSADGDGYACLVVQHVAPAQENLLVELLARVTLPPSFIQF